MESAAHDTLRWLPLHHQMSGLHAGFWRRVVAWLLDFLVLAVIGAALLGYLRGWIPPWAAWVGLHTGLATRVAGSVLQPAGIIVGWLYFALCESSRWQATPGKLALGLRVTDEHGQRIGFARASGRYFGKYLSAITLCIGFLLAGWTPRKQALHDLVAGCCVVRGVGLALWRQRAGPATTGEDVVAPGVPASGMPGWAIALLAVAGIFFVALPMLAIMAAIAIPVYQGHVVRGEVAQGIQLSERARSLVAEYMVQRGSLPDSNAALGLPRPEAIHAHYVSSVRVAGGKVVVTYGNEAHARIHGGHVVLSPQGNAARLNWRCSSPDIRKLYLPDECRR